MMVEPGTRFANYISHLDLFWTHDLAHFMTAICKKPLIPYSAFSKVNGFHTLGHKIPLHTWEAQLSDIQGMNLSLLEKV